MIKKKYFLKKKIKKNPSLPTEIFWAHPVNRKQKINLVWPVIVSIRSMDTDWFGTAIYCLVATSCKIVQALGVHSKRRGPLPFCTTLYQRGPVVYKTTVT